MHSFFSDGSRLRGYCDPGRQLKVLWFASSDYTVSVLTHKKELQHAPLGGYESRLRASLREGIAQVHSVIVRWYWQSYTAGERSDVYS